MTLGAGLVLSGCGDDDTATTPAPAPPPPPPPAPEPEPEPEPPPAPEPPATPTGLHVDETTETSIEWHWNAVEGASAYVVQYSMNEMFGDEDDRTDITLENHYAVTELEPDTTVYLRVAAAIGTSLEDAVHSAFTTHVTGMSNQPPPPPPPPMAPATPTGFMVESDMTSITWSWDAVEGALGYAIQVSEDEMFDDMDHLGLTLETSHTVSPLPPGTTLFARVASGTGTPEAIAAAVATGSLEGLLVSAWTTHMTGMTEVPPPPPPPTPDPVEVTFSLSEDADDPHFLIADENDDKEAAMASVNTEIMVSSNTSAVITAMFAEDANGVSVTEGDNMPFSYVDWGLLQSDALASGATFMIQRTTMGANQEMEPSGDVAYVTCGPFRCAEGMDVPELTIADSAVCEAWEFDLMLEVGMVDNDGVSVTVATTDTEDTDPMHGVDGYDLGWVYTSTADFTSTHEFGPFDSVDKVTGKKGTDKALAMKAVASVISLDGMVDHDDSDSTDDIALNRCQPDSDYDVASSSVSKPDSCFRLHTDQDYLANYEVSVTPTGAGVSWGSVDWEEEGYFEDLTCEGTTQMAADDVDVCMLFEEEVMDMHADKLSAKPVVKEVVVLDDTAGTVSTRGTNPIQLVGFQLAIFTGDEDTATADAATSDPGRHDGDRYTAVWYHDGTEDFKDAPTDLYLDYLNSDENKSAGDNMDERGTVWVKDGWAPTVDKDGDPLYGDLGKADVHAVNDDIERAGEADNFGNIDNDRSCTTDDGGTAAVASSDGETVKTPGSACDAEDVEIETSVIYTDNFGDHACEVEITYTITCQWDADGEIDRSRTDPAPTALGVDNVDSFLECTAEMN